MLAGPVGSPDAAQPRAAAPRAAAPGRAGTARGRRRPRPGPRPPPGAPAGRRRGPGGHGRRRRPLRGPGPTADPGCRGGRGPADRLASRQGQHQREGLGGGAGRNPWPGHLTLADGLLDPAADGLGAIPSAEGGHGKASPRRGAGRAAGARCRRGRGRAGRPPAWRADRALGGLGDAHRPTSLGRLRRPRRAHLVGPWLRLLQMVRVRLRCAGGGHASPKPGSW